MVWGLDNTSKKLTCFALRYIWQSQKKKVSKKYRFFFVPRSVSESSYRLMSKVTVFEKDLFVILRLGTAAH